MLIKKGVRNDRLKTRDTDLIRKLKARGMTYRQIAQIAGCPLRDVQCRSQGNEIIGKELINSRWRSQR